MNDTTLKAKLETELWQLEVVTDNPEFLTKAELKRELKRIVEIKALLKG